MYKITFHKQPRQGIPDTEFNSIELTKEQYLSLPELSSDIFDEKCDFEAGMFTDQVRHEPENRFDALWIYNDDWKMLRAPEQSSDYLDDTICWVFVCIDEKEDFWIAFEFCDYATVEDAYCSTVSVTYPSHGPIYRLGEDCMAIVHHYFH